MAQPRIPVNRLHPTDPNQDSRATFDVFFLHGLQNSASGKEGYEKTWTTTDNKLWPREWLPYDLNNIRVFSISYDAEVTKWFAPGNDEDVDFIGENLVQELVLGCEGIGSRPFALVGHSFGGLVIKALVNETKRRSESAPKDRLDQRAISRTKEFLENLKCIIFYAVPHSGADAKTLAHYFFGTYSSGWSLKNRNLAPFSRKMEKMSVMMEDAFYDKKIIIYAFAEGEPTSSGKRVVETASAMRLARNNFYLLEGCNHMQVCKPHSKADPSYSKLLYVLSICRAGTRSGEGSCERAGTGTGEGTSCTSCNEKAG